jgi:sarcosine oxidase subunit gamma
VTLRNSALETALESLTPEWGELYGMRVPLSYTDAEVEGRQMETLALADLSALPKLGLKGPGVDAFVAAQGIEPPADVYGFARLPGGGWVIRVDGDELFMESGIDQDDRDADLLKKLDESLGEERPGVYRIERQETGLLLSGTLAVNVIRQTCGYPFEIGPGVESEFVYARVAVTSCAILKHSLNGFPVYRIWCVPSSGRYLLETLLDISRDLGGQPVGLSCYRARVRQEK